jgi:hypothetical protein
MCFLVVGNMLSKEIAGIALVFGILVSCYVGMVEIVNIFASPNVLQEFNVKSLRHPDSDDVFVMGDSLVGQAFSDLADAYQLEVYHGSVLILKKEGSFSHSKAEIVISLFSPTFSVGKDYLLVFYVQAYNKPILGASFSDHESYAFETVNVGTKLNLTVEYNESWRSLSLCANLTDVEGYPIANETVLFSVQYCGRQRATNGWTPIGSAVSNMSGLAFFNSVFNVRGGTYHVKAFHAEDASFGEAECVKPVNVSSAESFGVDERLGFGFLSESGSVTIEVSSSEPYAKLPLNATATYESSTSLQGDFKVMIFWWHGLGRDFCVGVVGLMLVSSPSPYVYEALLTWTPDVIGYDSFIGGVLACDSGQDIDIAIENGEGVVAFGLVRLDIQRCPLNLVYSYPESAYGNSLPVTVGVSMPRTYEESRTDFCVMRTLAPMINYCGLEYMLDEPVGNHTVRFLVNGTLVAVNHTDNEGLVAFSMNLNSSSSGAIWNLTSVVDTGVFEGKSVKRVLNMSKVTVHDVPSATGSIFALNYTIKELSENGSLYAGLNTTLTAKTELFNHSVSNCPVSILTAKSMQVALDTHNVTVPWDVSYLRILKTYETLEAGQRVRVSFHGSVSYYPDSQGCVWIPSGANGKSVIFYEEPLIGDVNMDGKVDGKDIAIVVKAYNSRPGDPNWDPGADLNGDLKVDGKDLGIVSKHINDTNTINVDVEFLFVLFAKDTFTDGFGSISEIWNTGSITGGLNKCMVQVKLPPSFNVTGTFYSGTTSIDACVNIIRYFDLVPRPVNMTVDLIGQFNVTTVQAEADAYVYQSYPNNNYGSDTALWAGWWGGAEFRTYIRFDLSTIPEDAHIVSARLNLYRISGNDFFEPYEIYQVTSPWEELSINWNNQPSLMPDPFSVFDFSSSSWSFVDVTAGVRMCHNSSACNYGFVLKRQSTPSYDKWMLFCSRESSLRPPMLEVSYVSPSPKFVINVLDAISQEPLSKMSLEYSCNNWVGETETNSSGVTVLDWRPTGNTEYLLDVVSPSNATFRMCEVREYFDLRLPTNITSLVGSKREVVANLPYDYGFWLASSSIFDLRGKRMWFFVNGTRVDGDLWEEYILGDTGWNGTIVFPWTAPAEGTYSVRAVFKGDSLYKECESWVTVMAKTVPLAVLFSVSPKEFEPGASMLLNATIMDVSTNAMFTGTSVTVDFFKVDCSGFEQCIGSFSNNTGTVYMHYAYPNDYQAYAFYAKIHPVYVNEKFTQGIASNPVQLTVSKATKLFLRTTRSEDSTEHTVDGWLQWGIQGVRDKTITVKVNDTVYTLATNENGYFKTTLKLEPRDYKPTTYMITATFEGDSPLNATAWTYTLDGQRFAACTTIQYGYKPSCNSTTVTVEPQATQETMSTKTPEQMQKEAEQSGWLRIEPEFSWWFPWFRLHYKLDVNLPQGNPKMDYGWSPLPFGESSNANEPALANIMNDATEGEDPYALAEFFAVLAVPFIIQATAAYIAGRSILGIVVATLLYGAFLGVYTAVTYARAAGNPKAFLMAFMGAGFVEMTSLFLIGGEGAVNLIRLLTTGGRLVLQKIHHPLQALHALKLGFFAITNAIFALMDFAVMAFYLSMYLRSI